MNGENQRCRINVRLLGTEADLAWLFGSLTDPDAEGTGIYFGKDPKTMFVNVQHSAAEDGDATWAISKDK